MKPEYSDIPVVKNDDKSRFELVVDGYTAFIDFKEKEKDIYLIHTESPEELAGRGVPTALIEKTLLYLEDNGFLLVPLCPMVFAYIKRHPEWIRMVTEDFKPKFSE